VPEAARALGISERAVRKRITAGTLDAEKEGTAWAVFLPAGPKAEPGAVPGGTGRPPEPRFTPVNIQPLADIIERQGEEIRRLAEAATAWQFRAVRTEEQLQALEAGPTTPAPPTGGTAPATDRPGHDAPRTPPAVPGGADASGSGHGSRWRGWLRRLVEGG